MPSDLGCKVSRGYLIVCVNLKAPSQSFLFVSSEEHFSVTVKMLNFMQFLNSRWFFIYIIFYKDTLPRHSLLTGRKSTHKLHLTLMCIDHSVSADKAPHTLFFYSSSQNKLILIRWKNVLCYDFLTTEQLYKSWNLILSCW